MSRRGTCRRRTTPMSERMSSVATHCRRHDAPAINPWFVAIAVVVPTFMEVLDTTIANVALRYIAGGLSAAETDSEWVITSYLAANAHRAADQRLALGAPGPAQLFSAVDRRVHAGVGACAAWRRACRRSLLFRVIQGLAGGGLQPSSQAILIDSFPPEKQGTAMTHVRHRRADRPDRRPDARRLAVVNYDWRWIFYINVPVGIVALAASYFLVQDPDYLKQERAEAQRPAAELRLHRAGAAGARDLRAGKCCSAKDKNGIGSAIRSGGSRR